MVKRLSLFSVLILAMLMSSAAAVAPIAKASSDTPPYAVTPQNRAAAADALKEVDELLKRASEITGLPVRRPVKSAVANRESIRRYIQQRIKQMAGAEKMRGQEVALKKFGLLPRDYDLQSSTEKLLTEQAAAYYDPKRKEIYVADWTPIEMQRPAILHELTHALQDQQIDLDQFLEDKKLNQDEQMAHAAVVEGGAVLAMMDYLLSATGMKIEAIPGLDEMVASATSAEINKFPVYAAAPLYLREALLFPYTVGMQYVRVLVQAEGKPGYLATLKNPPRSTADVMHPAAPVGPVPPDLKAPEISPPAGYSLLIDDVLGELDVQILLKQYAGEETASEVAPGWRGLRFAVYENAARSSSFLVHRSRWSSARAAQAFADAYRKVLAGKGEKNARLEIDGETVTVYEGVPQK